MQSMPVLRSTYNPNYPNSMFLNYTTTSSSGYMVKKIKYSFYNFTLFTYVNFQAYEMRYISNFNSFAASSQINNN